MLDIKNAIRIEVRRSKTTGYPTNHYIFNCLKCNDEIAKTKFYAKKCTGYCTKCISSIIHKKERISVSEHICRICNTKRSSNEFRFRNGLIRSECNHCINIKRQFGITANEYDNLLLKQNNACAICKSDFSHNHQNGKKAKLAIDHCHETNKIRGLLCCKCNMGIGLFRDNTELLINAVDYFNKNK